MKLVFVYWGYENAGSMLDLRGYSLAASAWATRSASTVRRSPPLRSITRSTSSDADAVVFVFEWTTALAVRRPARLGEAGDGRAA